MHFLTKLLTNFEISNAILDLGFALKLKSFVKSSGFSVNPRILILILILIQIQYTLLDANRR